MVDHKPARWGQYLVLTFGTKEIPTIPFIPECKIPPNSTFLRSYSVMKVQKLSSARFKAATALLAVGW